MGLNSDKTSKVFFVLISVKNHPIFMKFCTQQQILNWMNVTDQKCKFRKFKMADGRHFENYYIAISQ